MKKKAVPKVRIDKRSLPTELEQLLNMTDAKIDTAVYDSEETDTISFDEDLELLDIEKLILEELDSFKPVSRDLRIDDSSMPIAKNFFHFCMDEAFLNSPPYLEQAIIGIKLMAEYCPRSTCTDMEWFSDDGHEAHEHMSNLTKKVSLLNHGVCPKCGARKSELIASGELYFYNELAVVAGQRSGKSALSTMISAYVLHLFLKCGKPTELFGIRSNEVLHGTFLALTLGQATQNLWQPFLGYINNSPWFKNYHILLRKYERKYGETILKLKDTFIEYRHRNLQLYPATPDKRVLRGRTRFLGVLDELGWFDSNRDSNKVKDNAHEVYKAMSNSLATARQSENRLVALGYDQFMLTGYMLNVSSPNNIRDKIMELYKQSIGSKKSLGLHKPTWKMNPHIPFDGPLIQEEYRKDPIGAERDFGAQPSLSSNPFISNHRLIQETVREGQKNWIKYRSKIDRVSKDEKYRTVEIQNIKRNDSVSVLAIDAGYSNNSFALACGSIHDGTPHIDALIEVISLPGIPISHTRIFSDVIMPIIEHRNVKILLADRWNSIKLLQDAKASFPSLDISAQYSLKYNDMYDLKTAIELGAFKIPHIAEPNIKSIMENLNIDEYPNCFDGKPVEHLLVQMATVVDIGKKTVDKGDGFTDDLWRASALCHWALVNPEYQEILAKVVEQSAKKQPPLAVVRKLGSYDKLTSSSGTRVFSGTSKFIGTKKTSR